MAKKRTTEEPEETIDEEEQVEEEENAMELVAKIKLADGDNRLIYELNKELGARAPSAD